MDFFDIYRQEIVYNEDYYRAKKNMENFWM